MPRLHYQSGNAGRARISGVKRGLKWLTRRVKPRPGNWQHFKPFLALDAVRFPRRKHLPDLQSVLESRPLANLREDLNPCFHFEAELHRGYHAPDRALRHSEERFRRLADNVAQFVWMSEGNGPVWYNQRWRDYTGLTVEEMQANGWRAAVHPTQIEQVLRLEKRHAATAETWDRVIALRRHDGVYRSFLLHATAARDPESGVVHWFGTSTDIEDRLKAEQNLRQANLNLQHFASAAAHDLQEPLRNVALTLSLLKRLHGSQLCDASTPLVDECIECSLRMHTMLQDLLAFARVEELNSGEISSIDAAQVVRQVLENLRTSIHETDAEITWSPLPLVKMRHAHLLQLLQNLIGNSLKYRHALRAPELSISAARRPHEWLFSVQDNGIGFETAHGQRIFGMFKRLHARDEYSGSGIGLATCARIVQSYGGEIWAEGRPGFGATFFFTIPD